MRNICVVLCLMIVGLPATSWSADKTTPEANEFAPVDKLPEIKELPDPFMMLSGKRVKTREDWRKRREEIKAMLLYYQFVGGRGHC